MRYLLGLLTAGLAAGLLAVGPAAAAPPDRACSSPTLTGTNDAGDGSTVIPPGEPFEVDGCGFRAGQAVTLEVYEHGDFVCRCELTADDAGRFVYTGITQWGAYRFRAFVARKRGFVAEWWFGSYA